MASRHTEHYGLSQWEASDKVERTDFNADNAAVDGALHAAGTVQGGDRRPLPALRPCGPEGGPDRPGGAGGAAGQQGGSGGPERRGAPACQPWRAPCPAPPSAATPETGPAAQSPLSPSPFPSRPSFWRCAAPAPPPTAPACSSSGASPREAALGHIDFYVNVTWSGNQVSWYTSKDNPSTQMNSEGVEYFYFAIG